MDLAQTVTEISLVEMKKYPGASTIFVDSIWNFFNYYQEYINARTYQIVPFEFLIDTAIYKSERKTTKGTRTLFHLWWLLPIIFPLLTTPLTLCCSTDSISFGKEPKNNP